MKKCEKVLKSVNNYETILPFSCCPLVFLWLWALYQVDRLLNQGSGLQRHPAPWELHGIAEWEAATCEVPPGKCSKISMSCFWGWSSTYSKIRTIFGWSSSSEAELPWYLVFLFSFFFLGGGGQILYTPPNSWKCPPRGGGCRRGGRKKSCRVGLQMYTPPPPVPLKNAFCPKMGKGGGGGYWISPWKGQWGGQSRKIRFSKFLGSGPKKI